MNWTGITFWIFSFFKYIVYDILKIIISKFRFNDYFIDQPSLLKKIHLPRSRGRVSPRRCASVCGLSRQYPSPLQCYLSPHPDQTGTGRRTPGCASIECPQKHCGVSAEPLKRTKLMIAMNGLFTD